jgi:hypothetical protein
MVVDIMFFVIMIKQLSIRFLNASLAVQLGLLFKFSSQLYQLWYVTNMFTIGYMEFCLIVKKNPCGSGILMLIFVAM